MVGPDWKGALPANVVRIDSPTNMVIVWGRVAVNGPADVEAARAVQDSFALTPLGKLTDNPTTPEPDWEASQDRARLTQWNPASGVPRSLSFFHDLGEAIKLSPPRRGETAVVEQFAEIGLTPEDGFSMAGLDSATIMGLSRCNQGSFRLGGFNRSRSFVGESLCTVGFALRFLQSGLALSDHRLR